MDIIVKNITEESEMAVFQALLLDFYREINHQLSPDTDLLTLIIDFNRKGVIKIAKLGDEIVGFITLVETNAIYAGGKYGVINELYVRPKFRSEGIGKQLLSYAEQIRIESGWSRLELSTPEESKWRKTINFYLREGFVPTGKRMKKE
jgi:GNAT superfamily N-acetyltransferase